MGTVQIAGKLMEWSGKALQRADIAKFIEERAEAIIEKQSGEIAISWFQKVIRGKKGVASEKVVNEFGDIYRSDMFNRFMSQQINEFDDTVIVPLVEAIEEYSRISDDRFYALPKFLVFDRFQDNLNKNLNAAAGLPDVFHDVFGKQQTELVDQKITKLIEFVSGDTTQSAIEAMDKISQPAIAGLFRNKLNTKVVRHDVYFWGDNKSSLWKEGSVRGHYYFDKRDRVPSPRALPGVENMKNRLETRLLNVGPPRLVIQLEEAIKTRIPSSIRDNISIKLDS